MIRLFVSYAIVQIKASWNMSLTCDVFLMLHSRAGVLKPFPSGGQNWNLMVDHGAKSSGCCFLLYWDLQSPLNCLTSCSRCNSAILGLRKMRQWNSFLKWKTIKRHEFYHTPLIFLLLFWVNICHLSKPLGSPGKYNYQSIFKLALLGV